MYNMSPEWKGQKPFIWRWEATSGTCMIVSNAQNWHTVLCGKYNLYGYIISLLEYTYEVCYWLIFVFYYHCNFMCSWNIDCLCTLHYADANLIHTKDCPYWNFNEECDKIEQQKFWLTNNSVFFFSLGNYLNAEFSTYAFLQFWTCGMLLC